MALEYFESSLDARLALLILALALVLTAWLLLAGREPAAAGLPPGPPAYPLVGSLPTFAWEVWRRGRQPHQLLRQFADRYGPVFRLRVLHKDVVVLNDYASVKEVLTHPDIQDRPHMYFLTKYMGGSGVVTASGETWLRLRRFSLNIFKSFGIGKSSFEEKVVSEAEELLKELSSREGKAFNPNHLLKIGVANVISSVLFGQRFRYSDGEFKRLLDYVDRINDLMGTGGALLFFPSLRHLPFAPTAELAAKFRELRRFLEAIIDSHRAAGFDADSPRDLTDALLAELGPPPAAGGSDSRDAPSIPGNLSDLILAGTETSSTTLQWCLLYLARHPDVQQRVQDEIDAVVGRNRLPRLADKPALNYTQAVICEVQRLANVVPMGVAHVAAADTEFGAFRIRKGSVVVANMMSLFRDPTVWPDPELMRPERFLDDEGKAVKVEEFIPFGIGRRSCIGEHLAKMELFLFFAYFMHQFTFKEPEGAPQLPLKSTVGIVHQPEPFEICATRRH